MNAAEVLEKVKEDKVKFIQLQFTDIHGMIKSVSIPVEKLPESFEKGTWFDGSSIEGFTRIHESDMVLRPDPNTYRVLPWRPKENAVARIICDVYKPDGNPYEGDPRYILRKAIKEAEEMGFEFNVGPELEFFLFKKKENGEMPAPHDVGGYFDYSPRDLASDVRRDIVFALEAMGIEVEMSHHEVAVGQHEIDFKYADALTTADNSITFKHAVKSIAHAHEIYATFMPKPIFGENGSGMHCHQSLFSIKTGKNAFYDGDDKYKLSEIAKYFVGGQLKFVKEMSIVLSPTVNSYKRLVPGYEAPVYICWARTNRSSLIRVPTYSPGREQATRAELRCPDPSNNPYLAFAVMLKAGLEGIKQKILPPSAVEEDVYEFDDKKLSKLNIDVLPGSLGEAITAFKESSIMKEALGKETFEKYLHAKKTEWDDYRLQVSEWEKKKYFEST